MPCTWRIFGESDFQKWGLKKDKMLVLFSRSGFFIDFGKFGKFCVFSLDDVDRL